MVDGNINLNSGFWVNNASTVGTSFAAAHDPIQWPLQKASFFAQGRRWVFYSDGVNLVWRTSTDGVAWSGATNVRACTDGKQFSIHFDGTYVHYAYASGIANEDVYYRRGIPQSNGTITWSAVEQEICEAGEVTELFQEPSVSVDDSGYPFVAFKEWYEESWRVFLSRSDNNDGTWAGSELPERLESSLDATTRHMILPLTGGKMYWLRAKVSDDDIKGRLFIGPFIGDWNALEDTGADIAGSDCFDAVSFGNHVHLTWTEKTTFKIQHRKRTYGVGWSASHTIHDAVLEDIGPSIGRGTEEAPPTLYVFWTPDEAKPTADHVFYKTSIDDGVTWTGPVDWVDESADTFPLPNQQSAFFMQGEFIMGCIWVRSSPDEIRYRELDAPGNSFQNLGAGFFVKQWRENLICGFILRRDAFVDLKASFDGQDTQSLSAGLRIRHNSSQDLGGRFLSRHSDQEILLGGFIIRHESAIDRPMGIFRVRHSTFSESLGEFIIRHSTSRNQKGLLIIRHSALQNQFSNFIVRHEGSVDLLNGFIVKHSAFIDHPKGSLIVRHSDSRDLLGKSIIRHSDSARFIGKMVVRHPALVSSPKSGFAVRQSYPYWTNRRLVNGVISAVESLIGDAKFELTIEGVMDDIKVFLTAQNEGYDWTTIDDVPIAIRRATTYGVVAALYARQTRTFQGRVIPTVSPVTVTVISEDQKAMNHWADKMKEMLELYLSAQGSTRLWVSTADEEPVFSMEDIPPEAEAEDPEAYLKKYMGQIS